MSWFYRNLIRPVLFAQDSEEIHNRTLAALAWISRRGVLCDAMESLCAPPELPVDLFGLRFPNPVGLAAGMDKQAAAVPVWAALGFGFTELGGVTWHPQPGNPAPRMFRAVADEALINRMGFNNPGAAVLAQRLSDWRESARWPAHPVGINLGKSKITPIERAAEDYANSFRALRTHADFFVVNVSSPNTPNLRQLQDKAALDEILMAIQGVQDSDPSFQSSKFKAQSSKFKAQSSKLKAQSSKLKAQSSKLKAQSSKLKAQSSRGPKPILVKVAPDLSLEALDEILELAGPRQIAGIVATNTTITRPETNNQASRKIYAEAGGLSGRPLRARSTEVIRHLYRQTGGTLPIIGVGGIFNADDAWEKITAGASLIQLYTGLVYEGPMVVKDLVRGLQQKLIDSRLGDLKEAVGLQAR